MPEFQPEKQARYVEQYGLPQYDAGILTGSKKLSDLFEETTALCGKPKKVANWLMGEDLTSLKGERPGAGGSAVFTEASGIPDRTGRSRIGQQPGGKRGI